MPLEKARRFEDDGRETTGAILDSRNSGERGWVAYLASFVVVNHNGIHVAAERHRHREVVLALRHLDEVHQSAADTCARGVLCSSHTINTV